MRTFNLREPLNNFALLAPDQNLLLQEKKRKMMLRARLENRS